MIPVTPVNPVAPWLGGKRNLAKRICALLDAAPCTTYAEPFVGMGGIFLRRTSCPKAEVIRRYDSAGTLFYLDPPYWGCEGDYGKALFSRADFQRLSDVLAGIKGSFVLSINDVPEIRELFAWARIEAVTTTYTIGSKTESRGERAELLIRGGKL